MRKFKDHLSYEQLKKQCKKLKVPLNDRLYREQGWDTVMVGQPDSGYAIYNTFNGTFFGTTPGGINFASGETKHERTEWFQKLLNFFYTN